MLARMKIFFAVIALALGLSSASAEIRGAWIATVHNINFPTKMGLDVPTQKAQIIRLLDAAKNVGLNAVFFQVRPESDALYISRLEPWSRFLSGTQGLDPGFDPLAFCIAEARKRGIVVHAWLNPYRAAANVSFPRTSNHISRRYPQYAYKVGSVLWMDPGARPVQDHIVAVVQDLISRYDLAGIHFDDYFYPYPTPGGGLPVFPDDKTYASYRSTGGSLGKADWRRENVNMLMRRVHRVVHQSRPGALFGVSPFGIFQPGIPAGTKAGVSQYDQLFCDSVRWMREGSVDYLAPQLYWKEGGPQSFSLLLKWWRSPETNPRGVLVIPGIAVDRISSHGWPSSEIGTQLRIERTTQPRGQGGFILWNIKAIRDNVEGVNSML
jgi:uncharacterized lipoprotein YddW (UPF0748 family)